MKIRSTENKISRFQVISLNICIAIKYQSNFPMLIKVFSAVLNNFLLIFKNNENMKHKMTLFRKSSIRKDATNAFTSFLSITIYP